jgi:predicted metal-binding membrane protein
MKRAADAWRYWTGLADWHADHPEWWTLSISAAAWAVLLLHATTPYAWALCVSPAANTISGFGAKGWAAWQSGALGSMMVGWIAMTAAMMPPLAIPLIRHVAVRSFEFRRNRSVALFLAGIFGVWLLAGVAGVLVLVLAEATGARFGDSPSVAGFLLAALWQLTTVKRRALLRCHRTFSLAPFGWRADWDCLRYGFAYSLDCLASCWALMFATVLATHGLIVCLWVQAIVLMERYARRARLRWSALGLVTLAALRWSL